MFDDIDPQSEIDTSPGVIEQKSDIDVGIVVSDELATELQARLSRHSALFHPGLYFLEVSEDTSADTVSAFLADKHIGLFVGAEPMACLVDTGFPRLVLPALTDENRESLLGLLEAAILSWVGPVIKPQMICVDVHDARTVFNDMKQAQVLMLKHPKEIEMYSESLASARCVWAMLVGRFEALNLTLYQDYSSPIGELVSNDATCVFGTLFDEVENNDDPAVVLTILT